MRLAYLIFAVATLVLLPGALLAQGNDPPFRLQALLSPEQVRASGLQKLSSSELDSLNSYVGQLLAIAITLGGSNPTPSVATAPTPSSPAVIESRIDGEFTGWDGETIFKLQNGQIWQQTSYAYRYRYAYSPRVLIYRSGAVYKLKVEGVDGEISVRRLK
jgi:hypothetical protein